MSVNRLSAFIIAELIFALSSPKAKESEVFLTPTGFVDVTKKNKSDTIIVIKDKIKIHSCKTLTYFDPRFQFFQCSCFNGVKKEYSRRSEATLSLIQEFTMQK